MQRFETHQAVRFRWGWKLEIYKNIIVEETKGTVT